MRATSPLWALFLLLAAGASLPSRAEAQPPAPADKSELRVFRLKHLSAVEASRILGELLGEQVGRKGRMRITADERTNSLFATGEAADLAKVEALLQKLDIEGDAR